MQFNDLSKKNQKFVERVASRFMVEDPNEIFIGGRPQHVSNARAVLSYALHRTGLSYVRIGTIINRERTTAMHLVRLVETTPQLKRIANKLRLK